MSTSAFPDITSIPFEGPSSRNPLSFKHYNPSELIEGKTMKDWMRFSVVYWHTFRNSLSDPFGAGTAIRRWDDGTACLFTNPRFLHGAATSPNADV
jgi:xylose isomerase